MRPFVSLPLKGGSGLDPIPPQDSMPPRDSWADKVFPFHEMIRIFNFYLDLECWVIPADRMENWYPLRYHNRPSWPIEFDDLFGKRELRAKFNLQQVGKVIKEKKASCGNLNGFSSLFVPILRQEQVLGVLQTGVFLRE